MDIVPKGQEPAGMKKKMDSLFAKLNGAYPDGNVVGLYTDHKKWGETVTELYRALGYPDGKTFLEAYGYSYRAKESSGGRPKTTDPDAIIKVLQSKYPNGSPFHTVDELFADNPEYLPKLKTMKNLSSTVFGMPLGKYLLSIGLIRKKEVVKAQVEKTKKEEPCLVCTVRAHNGKHEMYVLSNMKSIHQGDYVKFDVWGGLDVYGVVTDSVVCTRSTAPDDIDRMATIRKKAGVREYEAGALKSIIGMELSRRVTAFLKTQDPAVFHPADLPPAKPARYIPWASCRGLSVEIFRVLDYLVAKEPQAYQYEDIMLLSDEVAELHVFASDVEDVLMRFPHIKMAMFIENRETGRIALGYSRSGYGYLTDAYEFGGCDPFWSSWTVKHALTQSVLLVTGERYQFAFSEDWEDMNYVYTEQNGTVVKLGA